jgi:hypothetical protein
LKQANRRFEPLAAVGGGQAGSQMLDLLTRSSRVRNCDAFAACESAVRRDKDHKGDECEKTHHPQQANPLWS